MKQQDYHKSITVPVGSAEVFKNIIKVSDWWTNTFKGSAGKVDDVFKVSFGKTKVDFKVKEIIPDKKIVWQVTDCYLDWINNKSEWKGTEIVWEISEKNNRSKIDMTHIGLIPGIECYKDCETGWNQYVGESLPKLIETGKGVIFDGSGGS